MVLHSQPRLAGRCELRHVPAIQDATVVKSEGGGGLYFHVCLAVDADDGAILGLAHAQFLKREESHMTQRRGLPITRRGPVRRRAS
jgi:hypothetical protein